MDRPALNGLALSSLPSITGVGNDYGYDQVFARQLEACARPGDVAVGLSTSGNSRNVVLALERARSSDWLRCPSPAQAEASRTLPTTRSSCRPPPHRASRRPTCAPGT